MLFREWRDVLVWMDLEMTGLDVEKDAIVEIAVAGHVGDDARAARRRAWPWWWPSRPRSWPRMGDFVRQMHERSGLLTEIGTVGVPLEEAGRQVAGVHQGPRPEPRTVPLCGNSIGMDRRFLDRYLPEIEEHLHYRSIDVSSIKELCRRWYREPFAARPEKTDDHRALPDIQASIAELRYYRETIFK